jgi:hypothetical protein
MVASQRSFGSRDKLSLGNHLKGFGVKTLPLLGLLMAAAVALSATASAGGINIGTPLVSGDVETFENRHSTGHTDLSPDQLQALSHWLEQHRSGWQGMITPASSEPIRLGVNLNHSDGSTTSMCVIARASGGYYLRLTGPHKWAYRSFLGILTSWAATRPLSDQELAMLRNLVRAT